MGEVGTNWAGNHVYRAARLESPVDVEALRGLVVGASSVRVLGTRHSFNEISDSEDLLVDARGLASAPRLDEAAGVVTVSPGTTFGDVARVLVGSGWAVPNLGSLPHISVIGAFSTGTHGSGSSHRVLASRASRLRVLVADGSLVDVRRGDPDFEGWVVSLGALGVVVEADLDLVEAFEVHQSLHDLGEWRSALPEVPVLLDSAYSASVFTRWGAGPNELLLKRRVEGGVAPEAWRSTKAASELLVEGPSLTARDEVVAWSAGLPHFRLDHVPSFGEEIQSEFFVPRERTVEALERVTALADQIDDLLILSEIRTVAADDLWLSPAHGRDSTCLHFTWARRPQEVDDANARVAAVLAPIGARPHWGKRFPRAAAATASYERIADFRALARRVDPTGTFSNLFVRTLLDEDGRPDAMA